MAFIAALLAILNGTPAIAPETFRMAAPIICLIRTIPSKDLPPQKKAQERLRVKPQAKVLHFASYKDRRFIRN